MILHQMESTLEAFPILYGENYQERYCLLIIQNYLRQENLRENTVSVQRSVIISIRLEE